MHYKKTTQSAFTLIDILVSVAIVSFLSSIVLFNVSEGRVRAQDAKMKTESGQIATAIEIFKVSNGGQTPIHVKAEYFYPQNITPGEMYQEGTDEYELIMSDLVAGGYISEIPRSPDGESYAYGESTDGTQAVFAAKLKSQKSSSTNTKNSCDVIEPVEEVKLPAECIEGYIPIVMPEPTYAECTYVSPEFTSTDLPDTTYTVEVTKPASWDCSDAIIDGPDVSCWVVNEGDPFWKGCDVQGYTWSFDDGIFAKLCPAPASNKAYSCVGSYYNPPPCNSVEVEPGYTCTNISDTFYEICPINEDDTGSLCDGSNNSDYCTCI